MMQSSKTSQKRRIPAERELLAPVCSLLASWGCTHVVGELRFFDRLLDVYGISGLRTRRTYAVELKLTRWRDALQQAVIYQLCADYVYVALPAAIVARVDFNQFKAAGVGLLAVHTDSGDVDVILKAARSPLKNARYQTSFRRLLCEVSN
jgi:hypothetical protein